MNTLPPISPLDLADAKTVTVQLELSLPRLTRADQETAARQFTSILSRRGVLATDEDMHRMVELVGRCLLRVATRLVANPAAVLRPFREERYQPWHERVCQILTLEESADRSNEAAIRRICQGWQLSQPDMDQLSVETLVIVVASLAVQGRLPLSEQPAYAN